MQRKRFESGMIGLDLKNLKYENGECFNAVKRAACESLDESGAGNNHYRNELKLLTRAMPAHKHDSLDLLMARLVREMTR